MKDLAKRVDYLSSEKRKLLEAYLAKKGIETIGTDSAIQPVPNIDPTYDEADTSLIRDQVPDSLSNISNYPEDKQLKLVIQNKLTTYLHLALPLCIILDQEKYLPWFYEHYLQIYSYTDDTGYLQVDYLEQWGSYHFLTFQSVIGYQVMAEVPDILAFIIKMIHLGNYVIINLDEYYLPNKLYYKNKHFIHQYLIYGYNNRERKFLTVGFDSNQIFTSLTYNYDEIEAAFEQGKKYYQEVSPWTENSAIELIKPKEFPFEYPFDINIFTTQLESYLNAKGDLGIALCWSLPPSYIQTVKFGMDVYDDLSKHLEDLLKGKLTMDYRAIHLFAQHKKGIYERLEYVGSKYQITGKFPELIKEYGLLVEKADGLRRKVFALAFAGEQVWSNPFSTKRNVKDIIAIIDTMKSEEKPLLSMILETIKLEMSKK
jgi:hypothetical protein